MDSQLLPLGRAIASDIRDLKECGLLLPLRKRDEKILLTDTDGQMTAVILTGPNAFIYFPVNLQSPHYGLFVPEVEILVDFSSVTNDALEADTRGALFLDQDSLGVIASRSGPGFHDPHPIRLWTQVEKGSDSGNAVFTRWGVALRDGDERVILFENDTHAEGTTPV